MRSPIEVLGKTVVWELRKHTTDLLLHLHSALVMTAKKLTVTDPAREWAIHAVVLSTLASRGVVVRWSS